MFRSDPAMKGAPELNGVDLACLASRNNLLSHRKRTLNYIQD